MKVVVKFLAIILFVIPFKVEAQNYFPFPDSNATWFVFYSDNQHIYDGLVIFNIEGDTNINNKHYNKIYRYYDDLFNASSKSYFGAINEDSLKRVYFYGNLNHFGFPDTIGEFLLYQFRLNLRDTVPLFKINSTDPPRTILSIDSVIINGEYRLRYYISNGTSFYDNYWIEGIGSHAGFFGPYYNFTFDHAMELYCFKQNGKFIWPDTTGECLTISVEDVKIDSKLKVYPNPTQNTLHIETSSQNQQIENIQIISLSGKNVVQTNQTSINTSELSQGIYFYQVEMSNGELLRGKFVKE